MYFFSLEKCGLLVSLIIIIQVYCTTSLAQLLIYKSFLNIKILFTFSYLHAARRRARPMTSTYFRDSGYSIYKDLRIVILPAKTIFMTHLNGNILKYQGSDSLARPSKVNKPLAVVESSSDSKINLQARSKTMDAAGADKVRLPRQPKHS